MPHCMIDLETWGTAPGCAIASIGAVMFDPVEGLIAGKEFYRNIDLQSCLDRGLRMEGQTVEWWMDDNKEKARRSLKGDKQALNVVLNDFRGWFISNSGYYIWSHGASFDTPIVEVGFRACGTRQMPWDFWNIRDTRTIYDLAGVKPDRAVGVHHNSLDDARTQAETVVKSWRMLKGISVVIPAPVPIKPEYAPASETQPTDNQSLNF